MYDAICDITGLEIRYFNVDSRMFPISAYSTGIFYAPAKLSDRRLDGSTPTDFFRVVAVDANDIQYELDELTSDMNIVSYEIIYEDMFYDSMFYRAMAGVSGSDLGTTDGGLPGVSGSVQKVSAMPAWNLTHFKVVYRTAYYNPYPYAEVSLHSDEWRAISYAEALELNTKINSGEATGVVDYSASSLYQSGTVFLKYYHGAYVNGTVTTENGFPAGGLWVTVQDEYGIPHQQVKTDAEGKYHILAPFGNVTIVISDGDALNQALVGKNVVTRIKFNVTDDQAMRLKQDLDADGVVLHATRLTDPTGTPFMLRALPPYLTLLLTLAALLISFPIQAQVQATEIGVDEITPLICEHSERRVLRTDRLVKVHPFGCSVFKYRLEWAGIAPERRGLIRRRGSCTKPAVRCGPVTPTRRVRAVREAGLDVVAVPGASAAICAALLLERQGEERPAFLMICDQRGQIEIGQRIPADDQEWLVIREILLRVLHAAGGAQW